MLKKILRVVVFSSIAIPVVAIAAVPVMLPKFAFHSFDKMILQTLSYTDGNVVYFRELGSITPQQGETMKDHDRVGCFPFYVMRSGQPVESGFDCRSFMCVGYTKGPKVCKDTDGKTYGGVVEILNRLSFVTIDDKKKPFAEYAVKDRTPAMQKRIDLLTPIKCSPFYLLRFDIAVGEGYSCEEIGKYPYYSGNFSCVDDWRNADSEVCSNPIRKDELEIRMKILNVTPSSGTGSSVSSSSGTGSELTFPDVLPGKYGYTAIMDLAKRGIIKGYPDGSFKPSRVLSRAELSKLLVATLKPEEVKGEENCFPDVRDGWFATYVCAAKRLQWLSGYPDGRFLPERTMKKGEGIKTVVAAVTPTLASSAALPLGTPDGQWYSAYVRRAVELQLILEKAFDPGADTTRADAAVWMYRALKYLEKTGAEVPR